MKNNTVVTAGDVNYLWGLFLLIASMRKSGMDEPVIVGVKHFTPRAELVLKQLGDVRLHSLDYADRSLTCYKAEMMLAADTEFVSWADSDAIFSGNCSARLAPLAPHEIHVRRRSRAEMPAAFPAPFNLGDILVRWSQDVAVVSGRPPAHDPAAAAFRDAFLSCSACFLSVARNEENFLQVWKRMMMEVLPRGDAGVVDRSLLCYHQLDESCLNATLAFLEDAPGVASEYRLDKDPRELFVHFVGRPKPWIGWTPAAARHFDTTVSLVEWALDNHLELPGVVPFALKRHHRWFCTAFARPFELRYKIFARFGI